MLVHQRRGLCCGSHPSKRNRNNLPTAWSVGWLKTRVVARLLTELRERTEQVEAQSEELVKLNQQLEERVADQVAKSSA